MKVRIDKSRNESERYSVLKNVEPSALIQAMNYLLSILIEKGVNIVNWDNRSEKLGMIKMYKNQAYYMSSKDD